VTISILKSGSLFCFLDLQANKLKKLNGILKIKAMLDLHI